MDSGKNSFNCKNTRNNSTNTAIIVIIAMIGSKNHSIAELLELSFLVSTGKQEISSVGCTLNP